MALQHLDTVIAFAVVMLGASLLITIFTQAMSTLFAHRGTNLRWGLKTLLETIDPGLAQGGEGLAQEILTHPILSDSILSRFENVRFLGWLTRRWRLASALRVEELVQIVPAIAQRRLPPVGRLPKNAPVPSAAAKAIAEMVQRADPTEAQALQQLITKLQSLAPTQTIDAQDLIQRISNAGLASVATLENKIEKWFNFTMDRVSQRFALQMRIWTVMFALLVAFAARLDSVKLFTQLSSDAELRAKLVGSADAMSKQAASILPAPPGGTNSRVSTVPGIYSDQMKELQKQDPAAQTLGNPPSFDSREKAVQWIRDGMKGDSQTQRVISEYGQLVDAGLKNDADKLLDQSNSVKSVLTAAGYQFIPDPYPHPWWQVTPREFWGILVSAGFLSLGAPFWFNALKTLTSLRPVVATKEENEKQQKQKAKAGA